jgi:hypothetical protein
MIGKRFLETLQAYLDHVRCGRTTLAKAEAHQAGAEPRALLFPTAFQERIDELGDPEPWMSVAARAIREALHAIADGNSEESTARPSSVPRKEPSLGTRREESDA